jgi:hypothetical protein
MLNLATATEAIHGLTPHVSMSTVAECQQGKHVAVASTPGATIEDKIKHLRENNPQFKEASGFGLSEDRAHFVPVLGAKQLWNGETNFKGEKGTKLQSGWVATKQGMSMLANSAINHPVAALALATAGFAGIGMGAEHDKDKAQQQGQIQGAQAALQQRSF